MNRGHVYVVRALLGNIDCDAVVVPTDRLFSVRAAWRTVLGVKTIRGGGHCDAAHLKPDHWTERGYGPARASATPPPIPVWFLDVVGEDWTGTWRTRQIDGAMWRLRELLRELADRGAAGAEGRVKPLIGIPALGTGGGGLGTKRGQVIDRQINECLEAARELDVDIVIAAAHASDHAAFQRARARSHEDFWPDLGEHRRTRARSLADRALSGELALFLGAGVSIAAGLPTWDGLLKRLAEGRGIDFGELQTPLDRAQLLRQEYEHEDFGAAVARAVTGSGRYAITHSLLAALGCTEVTTTNYDPLYERAAEDFSGSGLPVLPFDSARPGSPWLLKMHGDAGHPDTIVLTRSDYVHYDARARPVASVLQALMLTRHLLVVGTSMTDDNFLRLAHEVRSFRQHSNPTGLAPGAIGTVLAMKASAVQARLWEGVFDYVGASDASEAPAQARDLTIFLDFVAAHATRPAHLLDPRYDYLLQPQEAQTAQKARELLAEAESLGEEWSAVVTALRESGAT